MVDLDLFYHKKKKMSLMLHVASSDFLIDFYRYEHTIF